MEELKYNSKQELDDFHSVLTEYQKKTKTKVIVSMIGFIFLLITMFFERYNMYQINPKTLLFVLALLLVLMMIGLSLMYFFMKAKTLEYPRKKKDLHNLHKIHNIVFIAINGIVLLLVFQMYFISTGVVTQTSMEPTLYEQDRIIINHFNVKYDRYDIVVFDVDDSEDFRVKRIIGLPGETITVVNGDVYIDGLIQSDWDVDSEDIMTYCHVTGIIDVNISCSWTLEDDEYFVLGDNREVSVDSRSFGPIKRGDLFGEVILMFGNN